MIPILLLILSLEGQPPVMEQIPFRTMEACQAAADWLRSRARWVRYPRALSWWSPSRCSRHQNPKRLIQCR